MGSKKIFDIQGTSRDRSLPDFLTINLGTNLQYLPPAQIMECSLVNTFANLRVLMRPKFPHKGRSADLTSLCGWYLSRNVAKIIRLSRPPSLETELFAKSRHNPDQSHLNLEVSLCSQFVLLSPVSVPANFWGINLFPHT